jgi:hypothetical protein
VGLRAILDQASGSLVPRVRVQDDELPDRRAMTADLNAGIPVLYLDDPVGGEKGLFSSTRHVSARLGVLDSGELTRNLSNICARLTETFRNAQHGTDAFGLDAFEVTLDLTAKGEIRLIGSVSSEIHGGLKLTFRRRELPEA